MLTGQYFTLYRFTKQKNIKSDFALIKARRGFDMRYLPIYF